MLGKIKKVGLGVAALAGAAVGGAAVAGAATSHSGVAATSAAAAAAQPPAGPRNMPAPGTAAHEDAEKAVTGGAATEAKAAALKAVGEGTAGEVTTDYFGSGYEVTVTKSDGTKVEIHLDGSFDVMPRPNAGGAPPAGPLN